MTQDECLTYLKEHKHATAKDIARFYGYSTSAVQHNLQSLKKNNPSVYMTIEQLHRGHNSTYVWHYGSNEYV